MQFSKHPDLNRTSTSRKPHHESPAPHHDNHPPQLTMPWGLWSDTPSQRPNGTGSSNSTSPAPPSSSVPPSAYSAPAPSSSLSTPIPPPATLISNKKDKPVSWNDSLNATDWAHYAEPRNWIPTAIAVVAALGLHQFYRSYLRRLPGTGHVSPGYFRKRSLLGKVTSVGDGDNFHLFHTPGGRLAGWGWLRKVPAGKKEVRGRTIPIRLAGIDAPEGAHFGRTAQPFSGEALSFLQSFISGRRVRAYIYKRDQYDRIVATVFVRKPPFFWPRKDVGLEMIRRGLATTYEAKSGAEFGSKRAEEMYRHAEEEARRKGRGMWSLERGGWFGKAKGTVESPREYKTRVKMEERAAGEKK
ncbi:nuclease domain-containing protein [Coniochaeta sp. 2T2.1]|nr:nuclease domain-containing protein [Coniochaeta sp. 2T2.1]